MASLIDVENAVKAAMKAGQKDRTAVLRLLVSATKLAAKNDGNREVTDADLLAAGNRMIKQARETLTMKVPNTDTLAMAMDDPRRAALDYEIATVSEFLPRKMSRSDLEVTIEAILKQDAAPEGKAVRGYVMKTLNADYKGEFENQDANDILSAKLS